MFRERIECNKLLVVMLLAKINKRGGGEAEVFVVRDLKDSKRLEEKMALIKETYIFN